MSKEKSKLPKLLIIIPFIFTICLLTLAGIIFMMHWNYYTVDVITMTVFIFLVIIYIWILTFKYFLEYTEDKTGELTTTSVGKTVRHLQTVIGVAIFMVAIASAVLILQIPLLFR